MNTIKKDPYASSLFSSLSTGKNSYMRIDRLESSSFDMSWINAIEDCIHDLGDIVTNPRQVTKITTNIVPVELAKKTGAESVIHLASHSQYVKEVTKQGDVVPNKILSMSSEDDIHTYENRFIATLIRRLVLFIQKRYEFVKKFAPLHDEEILFYKSKAIVDGSEVEIETKVKIKSESDTKIADVSNKYIQRILDIREYILFYYGSRFMKELKTERDVRNPIVMTNILRKNPKYHKCLLLYKFIEKYDRLGVSYKVDEDVSVLNEKELDELNTVMFTNYLAAKARDRSKVVKTKSKVYKPRILSSLDDEPFIYGDLLEGPIEFLRVDQGYQDYLDSLLKTDIPPHPTKVEKEYYQEEIKEKTVRKAEKTALDKLDKRKKKEKVEFDKKVTKIIAQREKEERERIAREAEEARLAEERRIDLVRQSLIEEAMGENEIFNEEQPPVNESPVVDEAPIEEETPIEEAVEEIPSEELEPAIEEQEPIVEEAPVTEDEPTIEETPAPETIEEVVPEEVVEESPVEDVPQEVIEESPIEEETPVEESPVEAEPVVEESEPEVEQAEEQPETEPIEEPSNEDIEAPIIEEEKQVEEPINEEVEQPVEEDIPHENIEAIPAPVNEEKPVENEQVEINENNSNEEEPENIEKTPEKRKKPAKKPVVKKKSTPKKVKKEKKPAPKKEPKKLEKIPGKFIVKTSEGYYVSQRTTSVYKHEAKIFDDFNEANKIKKLHGGKVVKL